MEPAFTAISVIFSEDSPYPPGSREHELWTALRDHGESSSEEESQDLITLAAELVGLAAQEHNGQLIQIRPERRPLQILTESWRHSFRNQLQRHLPMECSLRVEIDAEVIDGSIQFSIVDKSPWAIQNRSQL